MDVNFASLILWVALSILLGVRGHRKKSLTVSGSLAAAVVGILLGGVCGSHFGVAMLSFYVSGSKLTKIGLRQKSKMLDEVAVTADGKGVKNITISRNATQVLCNSFIGLMWALCNVLAAHGQGGTPTLMSSGKPPNDVLVYGAELSSLSFFAACAGDTWASEVGVLCAMGPTVLVISPWRQVPRGTNGGVSLGGTIASILGGGFVGLCVGLYTVGFWYARGFGALDVVLPVVIGMCAGFLGSMIDSILGSVLQFSGVTEDGKVTNEKEKSKKSIRSLDVLSNNQVNVLASTLASALVGMVAAHLLS